MKKFILFLILSFSLLNIKVYASQNYPDITVKATFQHVHLLYENTNTYQYTVVYHVDEKVFSRMDVGDYYFSTSIYIPLNRGYIKEKNSYEITKANSPLIFLRVTLLKSFVDTYYSNDPNSDSYIANFFSNDSALYISYIGDTDSIDYDRGYQAGYQDGEQAGYQEGYDDGKQDGYKTGYQDGEQDGYKTGYNDGVKEKFSSKIYIWLVTSIIIVFVIGIFLSYVDIFSINKQGSEKK